MLPERLGSFEIKGLLGEGGSALVYAAHDGARDVALKVLHADLCADDKQVERFLVEAERMRSVSHRALVSVLGAGCLPGGRPFIVMPLLRGRTLADRLADGPVPFHRVPSLFDDVGHALVALHAAGLVHRDIKPENILWLDEEDRLVLLDLGIARDTSAAPSTTTRAGFQRGTPAYMAPERLFGQPATMVSDIYELALVLYMMLTARLPWDDGDALRRVQPELRAEHRRLVPSAVAEPLFEALSFDIARRPPSVAVFLDRMRRGFIEAVSSSSPETRTPPSPERRAALGPQETPPTPASVRTAAPTRGGVNGRSKVLTLATFLLGAGLAAGLAFGIPAIRRDRSITSSDANTLKDDPTPRDEPAPDAVSVSTSIASVIVSAVASPSVSTPQPSAGPVTSPSSSASAPLQVSVASSKPPPIREGTLPKGVIESRVRERLGTMKGCLGAEVERPDFEGGRVVLNFWIGLTGNVTSAAGQSADLPKYVVDCVVAQLRSVRFPQPEGGPVNVIFPIRFTQ